MEKFNYNLYSIYFKTIMNKNKFKINVHIYKIDNKIAFKKKNNN